MLDERTITLRQPTPSQEALHMVHVSNQSANTPTHDMTAFVCAVAVIAARRLAEEHQARVELPASSKEDQACR